MVLDKNIIQREVDATIDSGKYTEGLGKAILLFVDVTVFKRGLFYRYNEFEINFIIKPRMVDMLLLKVFNYKKSESSAYTYFSMVTTSAILDSIRDIRRAEKGDTNNVFYIEDMKKEILNIEDSSYLFQTSVYVDNGIVKLK